MKKHLVVLAIFTMAILALPTVAKAGGCQEAIPLENLQSLNAQVINFEDKTIDPATGYWDSYGVKFTADNGFMFYSAGYNRGGRDSYVPTASGEYSLVNSFKFPDSSINKPLIITFKEPVNNFGFYFGNGTTTPFEKTIAEIKFFDQNGAEICSHLYTDGFGDAVTNFIGYESGTDIYSVTLDYGDTRLAEEIDDFMFVPSSQNIRYCEETDDGFDPYTKGFMTFYDIDKSFFTGPSEETCESDGSLMEYICQDGKWTNQKIYCDDGYSCKEGACVSSDVTAPVIALLGSNPAEIYHGDAYDDAGATANDDVDGDITAKVVTVNSVNNQSVGTYTVTYNLSDKAGNPATEVVRTVNVVRRPSSGGGGGGYIGTLTVPVPVTVPLVTTTTPVPGVTTTEIISQPATTTVSTSGETTPKNGSGVQVLGVKIDLIDELIASTKFGDRSDDVKLLQSELQKLGFYPKLWLVTGYYGPMTKTSVEKYLVAKKLIENSEVLGVKINIIDELIAITKYGERSENVRTLQAELEKVGLFKFYLGPTGYYGIVTKASVEKYLALQVQ